MMCPYVIAFSMLVVSCGKELYKVIALFSPLYWTLCERRFQ